MVAIMLTLLASFSFSMSGLMVKLINYEISDSILLFFRYALCLILIFPILIKKNGNLIYTNKFLLHAFRSFSGVASMGFFFAAIPKINLINATFLVNTAPLFVVIILFFIGEKKINIFDIFIILIGLLGLDLIFQPNFQFKGLGPIFALLAGFFGSINLILTKKLSLTEKSETIVIYYYFFTTLFSTIWLCIFFANSINLGIQNWSLRNIFLVLGISIFGIIYQSSISTALKNVSSSVVAPLMYSSILFSLIIGWIFLNENILFWSLMGMILIIISSSLTIIFPNKEKFLKNLKDLSIYFIKYRSQKSLK